MTGERFKNDVRLFGGVNVACLEATETYGNRVKK